MFGVRHKNMFLTSVLLTGLFFAGCSSPEATTQESADLQGPTATAEVEHDNEVSEATEDQGLSETESANAESGDLEAAFAERDQFHKDQQLLMDGSPLSAVTPEQK